MSSPPPKEFNVAGVCVPNRHYALPVESRLPEISRLIEEETYFRVQGPRLSGKSTLAHQLVDKINDEGNYLALGLSLSPLRGIDDRREAASDLTALINQALAASAAEPLRGRAYAYDAVPSQSSASSKIRSLLTSLCQDLDKDLVVIFDEMDCLAGPGLFLFLAQLREGYQSRHRPGSKFPRSMILVGQRDLADRLALVEGEAAPRPPLSVFRISLVLPNFSLADLKNLYAQRAADTGQAFADEATQAAWDWTQGQPWLANALARGVVAKLSRGGGKKATAKDVDEAAFDLVDRREAPIESLLELLKEPRIVAILDPILSGGPRAAFFNDRARSQGLDAGLLALSDNRPRLANPIVREVAFGVLTDQIQGALSSEIEKISWNDGRKVELTEILEGFQAYWRAKSRSFSFTTDCLDVASGEVLKKELAQLLDAEIANDLLYQYLVSRVTDLLTRKYAEAIHPITLVAYLRRIVGQEARILVDCHEGRGGLGARLLYKGRQYFIEITLKSRSDLESRRRLRAALTAAGEKEGWLVIFDQDRAKGWGEKLYRETEAGDLTINVFGL
jgi:hypothetical protein